MAGDHPAIAEFVAPLALNEVAAARRWAVRLCRDLKARPAALHSIELLVSELATNVVLHAPLTPNLTVRAEVGHLQARFEFDDLGRGRPAVAHGRPSGEGGYGLRFVELFASTWGWRPDARGGKTVWFTATMR